MRMQIAEHKPKRDKFTVPKVNVGAIFIGGGANHIAADFEPLVTDQIFTRVNLELVAFNTDVEDLNDLADGIETCQLGNLTTGAGGAGTDPNRGLEAAMESEDEIKAVIERYDLILFFACLGGGTGSGALPFFIEKYAEMTQDQISKPVPVQKAALVIVTKPFKREGLEAEDFANEAILKLRGYGVPIIIIDNDRLISGEDKSTRTLSEMFSAANKPLVQITGRTVRALGKRHNIRNLDRNDISGNLNAVIKNDKQEILTDAHFAIGYGTGENAIEEALEQVKTNIYTDTSLSFCRRLLISVDAKRITEADWNRILAFISENRKHNDASWRYGLSDDFLPMNFEVEQNADVAIAVIGVGHDPIFKQPASLADASVIPQNNSGIGVEPGPPRVGRYLRGPELEKELNNDLSTLPTHRVANR